jgi:hypothetical protein
MPKLISNGGYNAVIISVLLDKVLVSLLIKRTRNLLLKLFQKINAPHINWIFFKHATVFHYKKVFKT